MCKAIITRSFFIVMFLYANRVTPACISSLYVDQDMSIKPSLFYQDISKEDDLSRYIRQGDQNFKSKNYKKAIQYYEKAIPGAKKSADKTLLAKLYVKTGDTYVAHGMYESSIVYYKKAKSVYQELENIKQKLELMVKIGDAYKNIELHDKSIEYLFLALKEFQKMNDKKQTAATLARIGSVYYDRMDYDKAQEFYFKSVGMVNKIDLDDPDRDALLVNLNDLISAIYYKKKEYEKALEYDFKHYEIKKRINPNDLFSSLNGIGKIYTRLNQYDSAFYYYNKAEKLAYELNNQYYLIHINQNLGHAYLDQNRFKKAIEYLKKSESLAKRLKAKTIARQSNMLLSLTYESMKDHKNALKHLREYIKWKDSLFTESSKKELARFEAKYLAREKEQLIALLNKDNKLKNAELNQKRLQNQNIWLLFGGTIPSIMLIMFIWHCNRRKTILTQQENLRFKSVIDAEQKERKRIAQDLHDSLGQAISLIKLRASDIEPKKHNQKDFDELLQIMDDTYDELHDISHNIMPQLLINKGLVDAVKELIKSINSKNTLKIHFETAANIKNHTDESQNIALYRIVQESLSNIIKHANATEVIIKLSEKKGILSLSIQDNGSGMDISKVKHAPGMGWKNIYSRVAMMLGTINVTSSPDKGTYIAIEINTN